jgi:hypothetical protein
MVSCRWQIPMASLLMTSICLSDRGRSGQRLRRLKTTGDRTGVEHVPEVVVGDVIEDRQASTWS